MEQLAKRLCHYVARMTERLTCPICELILTDCRRLTCGHWFCADCIEQHIRDRPKNVRTGQCPTCNRNITKASLKEDDLIEEVIDLLKNCADVMQDEVHADDGDDEHEDDDDSQRMSPVVFVSSQSGPDGANADPDVVSTGSLQDETPTGRTEVHAATVTKPAVPIETVRQRDRHESQPGSPDRSSTSMQLMAKMQDEFLEPQMRSPGAYRHSDCPDRPSLSNITRTRHDTEDQVSFANVSSHPSQFFDKWPYAKDSNNVTRETKNKNATPEKDGERDQPYSAQAKIGTSTPTRASFSPMASFFACSPIPKVQPYKGTAGATIDGCRQILDRLSASLPLRGRIPQSQDPIPILCSPPHSHTVGNMREERCDKLVSDPVSDGNTGVKVVAGADSFAEESGGRISRSCQTEAEEQTWCTYEEATGAESSLLVAIDRLCHEFSTGQASHPEYVTAVRTILQPVVEQVLTEMHSK